MSINCYIIDDEPLAIEVLQCHIEKYEGLEIAGKFQNAVKAFQTLQEKPVDLIFLDIQMPKLTGIELLRSLKSPPQVILTTAYREYAVEGFELDVVDYLLKPISFVRFLRAMGKITRKKQDPVLRKTSSSMEEPSLLVQEKNKMVRIPLRNILYIESQKDYVKIVTEFETYQPLYKMADLEEELRPAGFIRIHRSFLVPLNKIKSWCATEVEIPGSNLPIGRTYKEQVIIKLKPNLS
ncbi:LytTR family DNA-binding domain-containing protein [soil metagenome]